MSDFYEMPHWIRVSYIDINTKPAQRFNDNVIVMYVMSFHLWC